MRCLLLCLTVAMSVGCVEPILALRCAAERPFTWLRPSVQHFRLSATLGLAGGDRSDSVDLECRLREYVCHAGEMGLDDQWIAHPGEARDLEVSLSSDAAFRITPPNCYGAFESIEETERLGASYGHWRDPRVEAAGAIEEIAIWTAEDREALRTYRIETLSLDVQKIGAPNEP